LEAERRLIGGDRLQSSHRAQDSGAGKKNTERCHELVRLLQITIRDHEALAIFFRALQRYRACGAARADHQNAEIAKID
jgi:2,3-bisphosphoglycerate-independent phosphoglycerate mutase